MRSSIITLLCLALLASCDPDPGGAPRRTVPLDTISYRQELQQAREEMKRGDTEVAEAISRRVYLASLADPMLARQRATSLSILGQIMQRRSELDSAQACYQEALRISQQAHDTVGIGSAWLNLGVALDIKGRYAEALAAQINAMRWKEQVGDSTNLARVLHNMSVLYWRQDSLDKAVRLLQRSIAIKRAKDSLNLATGLNGLGVLLIEAQQYDSAIAILKESLVLEDEQRKGLDRENQLSNLGLAFERAGALDSAAWYYTIGLRDALAHGSREVEIRCLYGLGDVRRVQRRYDEARALLDSSLAIAHRIGSLEDAKEAHISLSMMHEAAGDPAKALAHYKAHQVLRDSLMNEDTQAAMQELRLRYDTEHKDRENEELRAAQELADLRADRNRWIAVGIAVLAFAVAAIAWVLVQRGRERARQREAELEQQALRLQMDPHFLFNALNTIPGLYATGDAVAANDHVAHLSRFLRLVLETSRRKAIPLEQEVELTRHYLRISANRKPGAFTWEVKVMPYVHAERVAIPPMLIQPVVENAVEHGMSGVTGGRIEVLVDRAGSVLHIEVRDNGVGRGAAAKRPSRRDASMGLDLVRKRIALFDRQTTAAEAIEVRDERNAEGVACGTVVTIRLRVQQLNEHAAVGDRG